MVRFSEPVTMLTDYLLGLVVLYWWFQIREIEYKTPGKIWKHSLLLLAMAAFTGGTYHGFTYIFSNSTIYLLTTITLHLVAIANFLFVIGAVNWSMTQQSLKNALNLLAIFKFLITEFYITANNDFIVVAYDYAISLGIVTILRIIIWNKEKWKSVDMYPLLGTIIGFLILAWVWMTEFSFASWFNHNDIAHLVQIGVTFGIYKIIRLTSMDISSDTIDEN